MCWSTKINQMLSSWLSPSSPSSSLLLSVISPLVQVAAGRDRKTWTAGDAAEWARETSSAREGRKGGVGTATTGAGSSAEQCPEAAWYADGGTTTSRAADQGEQEFWLIMPHSTQYYTSCVVWGDSNAWLTLLCLNSSWRGWEIAFHPLSTLRNTFSKSVF